jgi:hypothetical protein
VRDHVLDIAALARSRHVTACSGLPITQRVQTSGRDTQEPAPSSAAVSRALAILGRGYAKGGLSRRYALALWWLYGHGAPPAPLDLALGLTLTEVERLTVAKQWSAWGKGQGATRLIEVGAQLIGAAIGWYQTASEEPGCSGEIGRLLEDGDAARGSIKRLREAHEERARKAKKGGAR